MSVWVQGQTAGGCVSKGRHQSGSADKRGAWKGEEGIVSSSLEEEACEHSGSQSPGCWARTATHSLSPGAWVVGPQRSPHTAPAFLVRTLYLLLFPSGHPLSTTAGFGRSHQRPWPWDRSILKLLDPMDTEHCVTVPLGSVFLSERAGLFPSCFRCPWWDRSSRQESGNWEVRTWVFIQRHLPCPSLSPAHGAG